MFKIDTQIGIYKIKVAKIDRTKSGWPPIQQIEILVADVLKSLTIYYIKYDPNARSVISKNQFVRNGGVKLRFPYGQWCTAMEKITG